MGKFTYALTITLWLSGVIASFYSVDIAFLCWAIPAGIGAGTSIFNLVQGE